MNEDVRLKSSVGVIGGGKAAISIVRPMRDPIMTRYAILFALN